MPLCFSVIYINLKTCEAECFHFLSDTIQTQPKGAELCFFAEKICQPLGFIFERTSFILNLELELSLNDISVHSGREALGRQEVELKVKPWTQPIGMLLSQSLDVEGPRL